MSDPERDAVSHTMGVAPVRLDAGRVAAADRPRLVWSNVPPSAVRDTAVDPESVLEPGWRPAWTVVPHGESMRARFRTFTRPFRPGRPREFPLECQHYSAAQYDERGLVVNPAVADGNMPRLVDLLRRTRGGVKHSMLARRELAEWIHLHGADGFVRPLSAREREKCLGLPVDSSRSSLTDDEWSRSALLGNTWSVPIFVAHFQHLSACLQSDMRPLAGGPVAMTRELALASLEPRPGGLARRAEPSRAAGRSWPKASTPSRQ